MGGRVGFSDGRATLVAVPPKGVIRDYVETILVCVIFVIFSRAFAFQQSKIPSGSMEDTLLIGDYIMVNRFVYAPTVFEWEKRFLPIRDVRRGDIIVFKFPNEPEIDYIKRIVALPGDAVEMKRGYLYVNGVEVKEPYVKDAYRRLDQPLPTPITVGPGQYFAMGDHRDRSADSRVWGPVPRELIKGRALLIWWSYEELASDVDLRGVDRVKSMLSKVWHFPTRTRWNRCFSLIR